MNQKITIRQLAETIAEINGCDTAFAEKYLKTVTDAISGQLYEGNTAVLKQIGTFSLAKNDNGDPVEFNSDPELANLINSPFDMFESVELHESVTDDMLNEIDSSLQNDNFPQETEVKTEPNPAVEIPRQPVIEPEPEPEPELEPKPEPQPIQKPEPVTEQKSEPEPIIETPTETEPETETEEDTEPETIYESRSKISWQTGLIIGLFLGLIIGAVATYIYVTYQINEARAPYEDTYTEQSE